MFQILSLAASTGSIRRRDLLHKVQYRRGIDKAHIVIGGERVLNPRAFTTYKIIRQAERLGYITTSSVGHPASEIHITELGVNRLCEWTMASSI